jgi:hypothetical protein
MTKLLKAERQWNCPNCKVTTVTKDAAIPFHACLGLSGLSAPLHLAGSKVKVTTIERGDYLGNEKGVRMVKGRPIMALKTERPDGSNDLAVYAPMAGVGVEP